MAGLFPRALRELLEERVRRRRVTVLTGPRQSGKTTLVRDMLSAPAGYRPLYVSLDDPDERLRLANDPVRRLDVPGRLIILDEIQKLPLLLDAVKLIADKGASTRFLLLGSSQILLMRQVGETLAGRATLLELWPLSLSECTGQRDAPEPGITLLWRDGLGGVKQLTAVSGSADSTRRWRSRAAEHLVWGGFPSIKLLEDETDRRTWLRDFRRTYLERDLADLGRVADLDQFAHGQQLLAARSAQLLSYSEVARDLGVAVNTVKRYVRFLEISYQAWLLAPLHASPTTRLVKSPKFYWTDTALCRLLTDRWAPNDGPLFETYVLSELVRWRSCQKEPPSLSFRAVHGGGEIDFIVSAPGRTMAIEVKSAERAHAADARALRSWIESRKGTGGESLAILLYRGREIAEISRGVYAIPDWRFFGPADPDSAA